MNEKVRLGDVFSFIRNGANIKQGLDDSGYPITRIETISDRTVNREKMGYAGITDVSKYDDYVLQDGDILMSHINSEKHLGKTAIYKKQDDEKIIHGMNLLCLRPEKSVILPEYAFYFLSSVAFLRQIPNITKKSVNQASFTVTALKELSFAKCNINEQRKIIDELDKVTDLINKRKEQLKKLDELVKARFVELFGGLDCRISTFGKEFAFVSRGKSPVYVECSNLAVINQACIYWESINYNRVKYNESSYCGDRVLQHGDVLINSTGTGTLGRANVFTNTDISCRFMADSHVTIMRGSSTCNPMYIKCFLEQTRTQEDIYRLCVSGSTNQIELSKEKFRQLKLPVPSMELQEEFATFVEQTDKSKLEVQKSLEKLELLKKALMQKYFG